MTEKAKELTKTNRAAERVRLARHPERPYSLDLLTTIFEDFTELHGDRRYADDAALVGGPATLDGREVLVIGHQKGRDTTQRRHRNFGMPKPEGYRKALRAMNFAEKFGRPIICLIDTPGAYPGIDAEERGQAEAIAYNLREMAALKVPLIVLVLGEGGSGGALAVGIGDRVLMMENSIYSVISPEGCAAILWKDASKSDLAADCLRLTAQNLLEYRLIDGIIPEAGLWRLNGGSFEKDSSRTEKQHSRDQQDYLETIGRIKETLKTHLTELSALSPAELLEQRYRKFRMMGEWLA